MKCSEIAAKLEQEHPNAPTIEIMRMCSTIANLIEESQELYDEHFFQQVCDEVNLRLRFAAEQHEAVMCDLEQLTKSAPQDFTPDQIWILVRAIKVQSQLLGYFTGTPSIVETN